MQLFKWGHYSPPHPIFLVLKKFKIHIVQNIFIFPSGLLIRYSFPCTKCSLMVLRFCSLIFFSSNLSSGTHVLQFCVPKCKEMWIIHIDISYNITTKTKRIIQIHKNQICANNIYLHILETFCELSPSFFLCTVL